MARQRIYVKQGHQHQKRTAGRWRCPQSGIVPTSEIRNPSNHLRVDRNWVDCAYSRSARNPALVAEHNLHKNNAEEWGVYDYKTAMATSGFYYTAHAAAFHHFIHHQRRCVNFMGETARAWTVFKTCGLQKQRGVLWTSVGQLSWRMFAVEEPALYNERVKQTTILFRAREAVSPSWARANTQSICCCGLRKEIFGFRLLR